MGAVGRAADAIAIGAAALAAGAVLARGHGSALACCHDRGCTRTLEHCPAGITAQDALAVAARDGDRVAFVRFGGLACTRCGACEPRCHHRLPLARMFGGMQVDVGGALAVATTAASLPARLLAACRAALAAGMVGPEHVEAVARLVREVAPGDA